jgi:3-hydroxyethyl bacteriochlorophyllide a dehydrogenase
MGYPLVPGYETVGRVARDAGGLAKGDTVFVPGARCFPDIRCLFGSSAARLVVPADRAVPLDPALGADGVLISLAATAHNALHDGDRPALPDLIVGHGVLGRLIARVAVALGGSPVVHEVDPARMDGAERYVVRHPDEDDLAGCARIVEASGAAGVLDRLIGRLGKGGEVVLAGFYERELCFAFPPAFMRAARLRIAAEFRPSDLAAVARLVRDGRLSLGGLVTHRRPADDATSAYRTAFGESACLKMILDWRTA